MQYVAYVKSGFKQNMQFTSIKAKITSSGKARNVIDVENEEKYDRK